MVLTVRKAADECDEYAADDKQRRLVQVGSHRLRAKQSTGVGMDPISQQEREQSGGEHGETYLVLRNK
jgi:hypothetical protein